MDNSGDTEKRDFNITTSRDGFLFIIDVTPKMFEVDPEIEETYFAQCLKIYASILSKKLSWNRRDCMGLILFGTKKWDMKPIETKNIQTLQEFEEISTDMLVNIMRVYNNKIEQYSKLVSESDYPLHDVLWQAQRTFDSVKGAMYQRQVFLLTLRDNSFQWKNDAEEKHRIRLRAKAFSDANVKLHFVVLGNDCDVEKMEFYRDLEMLANDLKSDDVKLMKLQNLEEQIKFPSRVTGHLKWKIGNGVTLRTVISSFSCKMQYLKKAVMSKTTNEILDKYIHYGENNRYNDESDDDFNEYTDNQEANKYEAPTSILKAVEFGERAIKFLPKEVSKIRVARDSGIELLGFKEISRDYCHIKAVKFIGVDPAATPAEMELFAALLKKCDEKQVMATCIVAHKAGPYLANLTPCIRYNGFYANKIAYAEHINDLSDYTEPYVYVGGEKGDRPLPTNAEGIALMKKIIKKLRIIWDPYMFQNPKLNTHLSYVETLALDTVAVPVEDTTLPHREAMAERLGNLPVQFDTMFADTDCSIKGSERSSKFQRVDEAAVRICYLSGSLSKLNCADLKSFARSVGLPVTGTKNFLIERINRYFSKK